MREMTVREANQNFSQLISAAEGGETIIITKNGKPVAKVSPQPADRRQDPEWQAAYARLMKSFTDMQPTGLTADQVRTRRDERYDDDLPAQ